MMHDADIAMDLESACLLCGQALHSNSTLSVGSLPACNRFEKQFSGRIDTHSLAISECEHCKLVQLSQFPPIEFVRPRVSWIRYNEPAAHLDEVVVQLRELLPEDARVTGVGPFDGPLLDRLQEQGVSRHETDISSRLLSQQGGYPYLETIQSLLRPDILAEVATGQGTAELVSCRYLLEHSHDPVASLQGLRHLIANNGLLLIEVPDSTKFLDRMDYSFIWEEHICYFTEQTLRTCADTAGYEVVHFIRHPGFLEDLLIFVLRPASMSHGKNELTAAGNDLEVFRRYRAGFENAKSKYASALEGLVSDGRKVAIFGAGHQSIMFINALGLQRYIACVIDDASDKLGYLIPGTEIPIVPSAQLMSDHLINVCLLGVSPAIEEKIRIKCAAFLDRGGKMYSIFPGAGSRTLID